MFITRDLKDVVSQPPHILHLQGERRALEDDQTYVLQLELRSEYEHPTKVEMIVKTDPLYAIPSISSQAI